jgi:hypothetical protein
MGEHMKIVAGSARGTVLLWGAIAECTVGGVLVLAQISPAVVAAMGWGKGGSTAVLGAAMVCTAAGMVAVLRKSPPNTAVLLTTTLLLAAAAAATVVLGLTTLYGSTSTGGGLLLLLAVGAVGMVTIVVQLPRRPRGRGPSMKRGSPGS